ncbi:MAG: hypothetical protein ACKV19_14250 [Verrucomicrobiales bacterium]
MRITTAADLTLAHRALLHREEAGLTAEEESLLQALNRGEVFFETMSEVAAFFGVASPSLKRWKQWDADDALADPPYNVRSIEELRERMVRQGQRFRLRQSDLWPRLRRRHGL